MSPRLAFSALIVVALIGVASWPLPAVMTREAFGLPGMEAVDHLWALWAATRDGPVVIDTDLLNYPAGYRWVLVDPLNLVWFALGDVIGGPALGWNLIAFGNLAIAGLAAGLWAKALAPDRLDAPLAAAALAVCLSPMAGSLFTGMSEVLTMGWAALALLALRRAGRSGGGRDTALGGLLCGLTAWCGPYTAVYAVFAAIPVSVAILWRRRAAAIGPLLGIGFIAAIVAAPVGWAIIVERPAGLPGSTSDLPMILGDPGAAKNLMLGAEPLALFWPVPGVEPKHSVFLGLTLWGAGLFGAIRRRQFDLLASVGLLCVLGLGFFVQQGGGLVTAGDGRALGLPALWLSMAIEPLGRAVRWHRAVILAGVLLAGLAGVGLADLAARARRPWVALLVLVGIGCAEGLWFSPLDWPRRTFSVAPPAGYQQLSAGPILQLPLTRFSSGDPDRLRSPSLLWQTSHGQPLGGNPRQPGPMFRDANVSDLAQGLFEGNRQAAAKLAELGFVWAVVQHEHDVLRANAALGAPDVIAEGVWAWRLSPTLRPRP
ncbi:MAG: hypothetical protein AAFV53_31940 [Myxococcota bacterium]